jgi:hypothetical protein
MVIPETVTIQGVKYDVTGIADSGFEGAYFMTSVTIPSSITSIGNKAFMTCTGLTSVIIPHGVKSIGSEAFRNCTGLISVFIPNSVENIGFWAFRNSSSLTIYTEFADADQPLGWVDAWNFNNRPVYDRIVPPRNLEDDILSDRVVELTWEAPENHHASLIGYHVYRHHVSTGLLQLTEEPIEIPTTPFKAVDTPDGTHVFRVRAVYDGMVSRAIESEEVTIVPIPNPVTLIAPNAEATVSISPLFTWETAATGGIPSRYRLEVSSNFEFDSPLFLVEEDITHEKDTAQYSFHIGSSFLQHDTRYYWRVIAINITGESVNNMRRNFRTQLAPPMLPTPTNEAANIPLNQILTWQAPTGNVTGYRVFIGTPNLPTEPTGTVTDTSFSPTLTYGNTYKWRVVAFNDTGDGEKSDTWKFTTIEAPEFSVYPHYHDFGSVIIGKTSPEHTFIIKNIGGADLIVNTVWLSGTDHEEFTLDVSELSWTIAGGDSTTFTVEFKPTSVDEKSANINIYHNASGSPKVVSITGTSVLPANLSITPTSLDFGKVIEGQTSDEKTLTIENTGGADLIIYSITSTEGDYDMFTPEAVDDDWIIKAGETRDFNVTFKPTSFGQKWTYLSIEHNASGSPRTVFIRYGYCGCAG